MPIRPLAIKAIILMKDRNVSHHIRQLAQPNKRVNHLSFRLGIDKSRKHYLEPEIRFFQRRPHRFDFLNPPRPSQPAGYKPVARQAAPPDDAAAGRHGPGVVLEVVELDGARVVEGLVDPVVVDSVFAVEGVPVCEHEGDLREDDVVGGVAHAV